jgi:hypothetical protein
MTAPDPGAAFTISTPSARVELPPNRTAEVPFTVTNLAGRTLRAKATPRGIDPAPGDWFTIAGDAEQQYEDGAIKQVRVVVDPALGAPAGRYTFRLDVAGVENPALEFAEGPECAVDVPGSTTGLTTPRGYLMTLAGAAAGGVVFLALAIWISTIEPSPSTSDCTGFAQCLVQGIVEAIVFGLVLAFLGILALIAMWIVAAIGIGVALRLRHYRGGKLTATFFAVLMVPWTVLILVLIELLDLSTALIFFLAPVLLLIVPALLARALVLLIRTHRI